MTVLHQIPARGRRLIFAQTLDALTFLAFYLLAGNSVHAERNPAILALMTLGGIWLVVAAKVGLASHIAYRLPFRRDRSWTGWRYREPGSSPLEFTAVTVFMVSLGVAAGVVGAGFNIASLIDTLR